MSGKYHQSIKKLEGLVHKTLSSDKYKLRKKTGKLKKSISLKNLPDNIEDQILKLEKKINDSIMRREKRKSNLPKLSFDPALPITARREEIVKTIRDNQVVIISGETGSGKTTQLPKFCLEAGRGIEGKIACTQPRRIAAIGVSNRIAQELGEPLGKSIGYKIRFQDKTSESSYIKMMTDGILLAETQNDHFLNEYDTIIVDEAHERSLNIDFILGFIRTLLRKRKDLKLIVTSATIDTEKFSKAFNDAPIIEVSGRTYPVDVWYEPIESSGPEEVEQSHVEAAVKSVDTLMSIGPDGDLLIFMPTEQDIRETCEMIEGRRFVGVSVLPLYARLSSSEQSRVFTRDGSRKIIVSTNVAETSITIPGIRYVIDTGLARIAQYSPRSRTTGLPVKTVSKSSADQRMGRCGRVQNGICIRLFAEDDYDGRPMFTPPEILRSNLAEVILRMIALKLGNIDDFPFIDSPAPKSIKDGFDTLLELGAIAAKTKDKNGQKYTLTKRGKLMARLPVDPKLSRILIEAANEGCLDEATIIVSALSISDPRERPADKAQQADQQHAVFKDPASDFITLLNIWNIYHEKLAELKSTGKMKKFCKEKFLSFKRMREFRDIHNQLKENLKEAGLKNRHGLSENKADNVKYNPLYVAIHKAILSGYLSNIAQKKEKNFFKATKGREVMIFPGSGLFNKADNWVVSAQMMETSKLFALVVANIESAWLEPIAGNLCKYSYSDPHWEKKRGEVVATEQVSLFGLPIITGRRVSFGKVNPAEASEIFIRSALVEGEVDFPPGFIKHNMKHIDGIREMEDKIRKRDILVSEEDMYLFYRERLDNIYDIRTLKKVIKNYGGDDFLKMTDKDLLRYAPENDELKLYPDLVELGDSKFKCSYSFKPGDEQDGVTVNIPETIAPSVTPETIDWVVPGLFDEKITALIKGLPKDYRRKLVPISSTVEIITKEMPKTDGSLVSALGSFIYNRFRVDIPASAWDQDSIPVHLKMRVSITGTKGREIRSGRDLSVLKNLPQKKPAKDGFNSAKKRFEKTGIDSWDFGDLEEKFEIMGAGDTKYIVFPGLSEESGDIALRLFKDRTDAVTSHKKGIVALFEKLFSKEMKILKKDLALSGKSKDLSNYFGGPKLLEENLYKRATEELFLFDIRTNDAFLKHAAAISRDIYKKGQDISEKAIKILEAYHEARSVIFNIESSHRLSEEMASFFEKLRADLDNLVPDNYARLYDSNKLQHIARYTKAVSIRARRGFDNFDKEKAKDADVKSFMDALSSLIKGITEKTSREKRDKIEEFFWLLEEYKVSVFAQELKTAGKISRKKLRKVLDEIGRMI